MLNKLITDLKTPDIRYPLTHDLHSSQLGEYYFIFKEKRVSQGKDQALIKIFDQNGIPINRTYIDVSDKEYVYFPISIGQMGLAVFHTYLKTQSATDRDRFMKFVDWFYENAKVSQSLGARWLTDVPLPQYRNPGPWQSAFAQARGINILLRGYQLTNNKKYAEMAEQALTAFTRPVEEGGVTSFTKWGPFYEEYTARVPTLVLNGMIFSLCGLYDYKRVFAKHSLANQLFHQGIQTLKTILPEYDLGFWSRYNLCQAEWHPAVDPATIQYQRLHVVQLKLIRRLTGEPVFRAYADKFDRQDKPVNALRMYFLKFSSLKKIGRL